MTTSVTVRARAWGAKLTIGDDEFDLAPNEERNIHLEPGEKQTFTVEHGPDPDKTEETVEDPVPSEPATRKGFGAE